MLTRTLSSPEIVIKKEVETPELIKKQVDERGFYLYEWISSDELRMTLERDYLKIVKWASIPLAIITAIVGFIGFAWGLVGTILAVLGVLGIFYFFVTIILSIKFFYRSYLYTRGANVVITDNHYVSWGHIIEQWDVKSIEDNFKRFEDIFDEPFLGESKLSEKKAQAKTELFDNLKEIAWGGWNMLKSLSNSRDSGGIVLVILVTGFLYATMMWIVYFIGIFFISLFGRILAWLANRYLLMVSNREHTIQTLFWRISAVSTILEDEKHNAVNLLSEANQNLWKDDLTERINKSTKILGLMAGWATDDIMKLRRILESSEYKNIFNFTKYGNWAKKQILEPIESILLLLNKNSVIIKGTIHSLDIQIVDTKNPSLAKPVFLQKERLEMQLESFGRVIKMLEEYREKLI